MGYSAIKRRHLRQKLPQNLRQTDIRGFEQDPCLQLFTVVLDTTTCLLYRQSIVNENDHQERSLALWIAKTGRYFPNKQQNSRSNTKAFSFSTAEAIYKAQY